MNELRSDFADAARTFAAALAAEDADGASADSVQRPLRALSAVDAADAYARAARACVLLRGASDSRRGTNSAPPTSLPGLLARARALGADASINEELDDVNTADVPLLRAHALQGQALLRLTERDPVARLRLVQRARAHLSAFVSRAVRLGLLSADDVAALESANAAPGEARMDARARRDYKLARLQRQRAANERRDALWAQRQRRGDASGGGEEAADAGFDDESAWRAAELALLESDALDALDALEGAMRELEMLEMLEQRRQAAGGNMERARAELVAKLRSADRERADERARAPPPQKPITIQPGQLSAQMSAKLGGRDRQQIASEVFRPSHLPALYTPEEAAMLDMQEGKYLSGGANDPENDESEDEDADIDNAEKLKKVRDWDDFKDDNPKGAGNRSRMG